MKLIQSSGQISLYENVFSDEFCNQIIAGFEKERAFVFNLSSAKKPDWKKYDERIYEAVCQLFHAYGKEQKVFPSSEFNLTDSGYVIKKYSPGMSDRLHVGSFGGPFIVSMILFLNTHQSARISFPHQKVSIMPGAGNVLVFPPFWTHPHEKPEFEGGDFYFIDTFFSIKT